MEFATALNVRSQEKLDDRKDISSFFSILSMKEVVNFNRFYVRLNL